MMFLNDLRFGVRSLARTKGVAAAVIITMALGIGANVAIFSLVRGVLLRHLPNRDEASLIYVRQSAPASGIENTTFSMPEIQDLRSRVKTIRAFGDFSTAKFTMLGLGDPREVRAGVVNGQFFEVMGLQPVLGRLLNASDDGPAAAGAIVLTHRFWTTGLRSDPDVIGKTVRLGNRSAVVVGVLESALPYPTETEIMANAATSPHHLSAVMVQGRQHRMTELFGRLAPGATLASAQAELGIVEASMVKQHPEAYGTKADARISAIPLRDQITGPARNLLLVLLTASLLVFVVAVSNVANLILARGVRREAELAVRSALGASRIALRRAFLADSLLLCGAGAVLGCFIARPIFQVLAGYASRFSVRGGNLTMDTSMLGTGAGLAMLAAFFLAFIPRLPGSDAAQTANSRIATGSVTRLRWFAIAQIAMSFVLLAGSITLGKALFQSENTPTPFDTRHVLAVNVPLMTYGHTPDETVLFYNDLVRRVSQLPHVDHAALGTQIPWRDAGSFGPGFQFSVDGKTTHSAEDSPRAFHRTVSPGFFAALGVPLIAGRDFNDADSRGGEPVVIVSQTFARRAFPNQNPLNHYISWSDPIARFINISPQPRRVIGVAPDANDEGLSDSPVLTVYHPFGKEQMRAGRMFVHTDGDPHKLAGPIQNLIHGISAEQPVERAASLEDIRFEILTPDRLKVLVMGCFALVSMVIALVGVAGVIGFSAARRTREFGIRMALGSDAKELVRIVMREGAAIATAGVLGGGGLGFALSRFAGSYFDMVHAPGFVITLSAAALLICAAFAACVVPARRAARIDVLESLRFD